MTQNLHPTDQTARSRTRSQTLRDTWGQVYVRLSKCDDSLSLNSRGMTGVRRLRAWRTQRGAEKTQRGAAWRYDRTQLQPRMSGARTGGALAADRLDVGASRRMSQRWTV